MASNSTLARASASSERAMTLVPLRAALAGSIATSATSAREVTACGALHAVDGGKDSGAGFFGGETVVLAPDRDLTLRQRRQRARMQDLRAVIG